MNAGLFRDREDAGRRLARELQELTLHDPIVLGIPRGGMVVAAVLAQELGADCDVVLARKLRAPDQPELAVGAVSESGEVHLGRQAGQVPGLTDAYLAQERRARSDELAERRRLFREARPAAALAGRSVIVTDDGIATGSTMLAAVHMVRANNPRELILAVPVAPPGQLDQFEPECDRILCLQTPASFMGVGQFYEQFEQVEDETVLHLLRTFAPLENRP